MLYDVLTTICQSSSALKSNPDFRRNISLIERSIREMMMCTAAETNPELDINQLNSIATREVYLFGDIIKNIVKNEADNFAVPATKFGSYQIQKLGDTLMIKVENNKFPTNAPASHTENEINITMDINRVIFQSKNEQQLENGTIDLLSSVKNVITSQSDSSCTSEQIMTTPNKFINVHTHTYDIIGTVLKPNHQKIK